MRHCHTKKYVKSEEEWKLKIEWLGWRQVSRLRRTDDDATKGHEEKERKAFGNRIMREFGTYSHIMNFYLFDKHWKTPLKFACRQRFSCVIWGYFSSRFNTTGFTSKFLRQQRNLINTRINQYAPSFSSFLLLGCLHESHFIYHRVFDNLNWEKWFFWWILRRKPKEK